MLCADGIQVNRSLTDGQSPVFVAAEKGHLEVIKLLVAAGADVNARVVDPSPIDPSCSGLTPLGIARKNGHGKAEEELATGGAEF